VRHFVEDRVGDGKLDPPGYCHLQEFHRLSSDGEGADKDVGVEGDPDHLAAAAVGGNLAFNVRRLEASASCLLASVSSEFAQSLATLVLREGVRQHVFGLAVLQAGAASSRSF
jgi:hypothetical protein